MTIQKLVNIEFDDIRSCLIFSFTDKNNGMSLVEYLRRRPELKSLVRYVFFNKSFREFYPRSVEAWFRGFRKLRKVFGIENFHTKRIKSYRSMFEGCSSLEELNLMRFEAAKDIDLTNMFAGCENLKQLKIPTQYCRPEACLPPLVSTYQYDVVEAFYE